MTRPLLLACCLLLAAAPASAQVMQGWGDSPTNGAPTSLNFDCQSNSGASALVVSFVPAADIVGVTGFSADLRVVWHASDSFDVPLPAYWDLGTRGCRVGALSMGAGLQCDPLVAPSPVVDPWQAGSLFTLSHPWSEKSPGTGVCGVEGLLDAGSSVDLLAGHEYYIATFTFSHAKSVTSGACAGCCWGMRLHPTVQLLTGDSTQGFSNLEGALWNPSYPGNCANATPTRTSTWGSLKSTYR